MFRDKSRRQKWLKLITFSSHDQFSSVVCQSFQLFLTFPGLLIAVAPRYSYCSGATFTAAVAPLLLAESSGDSSAATFLLFFSAIRYRYFKKRKLIFSATHFPESAFSPI